MHITALLVHKSNIKDINTYLKITVNYQKSYTFASSITNNEYMKKLLFLIMLLPMMVNAQTLEECQKAAENNYPQIRQYDLISKTTDLTIANIQKGWLPQISATAQATLQSDVTSWPEQMQTVYQQMGLDMKGLKKDQYRVGVDSL